MCLEVFMKNTKRLFVLLFLSLSILLFSSCSAMASAHIEPDKQYVLSGSELQTLNNNLSKLRSINEQQQERLAKQQEQLKMLNEKLSVAEQQLQKSNEALVRAKDNSQRAEGSLTNANQSLTKLLSEEKETRLRIKRQRNMWEAIGITTLCLLIPHKV